MVAMKEATRSKKIRICGHLVEFMTNKNNKKSSNFSSIIFFRSVYFQNISLFLSFIDNIKFKLLSKYHNKFYYDPKNFSFMKKLVCYDYGSNIFQFITI